MPTGTFPRKAGTGPVSGQPDFSSVNTVTQIARFIRLISSTPTHIECEYVLETASPSDIEILREKIKRSALFNDTAWNALSTANKAEAVRVWIQYIVEFMGARL